jgi:VanZ family protein
MTLGRWLPVIGWAAFIFLFSTSTFGAEQTGAFVLPLLERLFPWLSDAQRVIVHGVIRKTAHLVEYGILSVLWFRALRRGAWGFGASQALSLGAVAIYAVSDEWHQSFVLNRTGAAADVGFDIAGACIAQLGLRCWHWITGRPPPIGV